MKTPFLDKLFSSLEAWSREVDSARAETLLPQLQTAEARQAVAEVVLALLQQWKVHGINQVQLLGCPDMEQLLQQWELPQGSELLQRVGHLLAIERALKSLYPYAPAARDHWVWRHNEMLAGKTPMEVMLAEGLSGIRRVRTLLEGQLKSGHPL